MKRLLAGYQRFRAKGWSEKSEVFESLAEKGQSPRSLVVACIDSRVDPAMIFDAPPGEMLTVRNVANLVPPYGPDASYHGTSAALEFGVSILKVRHVIVLGHGLCGGVQALLADSPGHTHEFITPWMSIARPALVRARLCGTAEERQQCCEQEVVKVSLTNLMTFPWISERVGAGKLQLHGAWFDIRTGTLMILRPDGSFAPYE